MAATLRGADVVLRTLKSAGVDQIFSLSGNQIMSLYDASIDEDMKLFHVRHEAAAVHMADAYGRLTGEPGVALLTAGPGYANSLSALYVALMAESPMVMLSGHAPQKLLGRGAFQEMAQAEMAGHVCKASWTAQNSSQLGHDIARAIRIAKSGRPGPVHISLPVDLLEASLDQTAETFPNADDFLPLLTLLDHATAAQVIEELNQAERPLVLAGPAVMRHAGRELLSQMAETFHLPAIGMESPRGINDPSLGAFAEVLAQADLIMLLGKQLDFTLKFAAEPFVDANCRFIQIDAETRVLERTSQVVNDPNRLILTALADPIPSLEKLIELGSDVEADRDNWQNEVQATIQYRPTEWASMQSKPGESLFAVEVLRAAKEYLDGAEDSVFISDGGEFGQWAQACLQGPHRVINGPSGSIGSSIPFALAARVAFPDSRIVTCLGDGTFGFQPMEFDTAVRYQLPFIALVGNDTRWNAEHQIQLRNYGPDRLNSCDLLATRYDEVVRAMGGHGEHVTQADELQAAFQQAGDSNLPACVNVAIQGEAAPTIRRKA